MNPTEAAERGNWQCWRGASCHNFLYKADRKR